MFENDKGNLKVAVKNGTGIHTKYRDVINIVEKTMIEQMLMLTYGNQSQTAKNLGINRGSLRQKMHYHGLIRS